MIISVLLFFLGWSCCILIHTVQSRKIWTCDNIKSVFLYSGFKAVWKVWWNWEGMMKDNSHFCKSAFNHEMRKLLCWGRMRMCTLARSVWGQNTKWFVGIFDVLWYFPVHFFGYIVRTTSAWFQIIWDFVWIISKKKKNVCFECEAALSFYFVFKIFDLFGWFREFGPSQHDLGFGPDHLVMIWDFFPLKREKSA